MRLEERRREKERTVDGRRGCVENTRFKGTGRGTQEGGVPAGWVGERARYPRTRVTAGSAAELTAAYSLI